MTNDEKLKTIGKEVLTNVFEGNKTDENWEYFSAVCYGQRVIEYGGLPAHGFFDLENLNNEEYAVKFAEKYPEKTDAEIWQEVILPELTYCANKITEKTETIMDIVNTY